MTAPPQPSVPISEARGAEFDLFLTITGVAEQAKMGATSQERFAFVEIRDVSGAMWIRLADSMLWKMALGRAGAKDELGPRSLMDRLMMGVQISYHGPVRRGLLESDDPRRRAPADRFLDVHWAGEADPDAALQRLIDPEGHR